MNNMISDDEWIEKYQPVQNKTGDGFVIGENDQCFLYLSEGEDLKAVQAVTNPLCVWTVFDANEDEDDDACYMSPGFSRVNVLGYMITKVPAEHLNITVKFD